MKHMSFANVLWSLWLGIFVLTVGSLGFRFWIYYTASQSPHSYALLLAMAALYFIFMLEGVQTAVIQIQSLDGDVWRKHLDEYAGRDWAEKLYRLLAYLFPNRDPKASEPRPLTDRVSYFLVGRQILSIIAVVFFAQTIQQLVPAPAPPDVINQKVLEQISELPQITQCLARWVTTSTIVSYFVAGVLQAWLAQLLPKILAKDRSVQMLRMMGAIWLTRFCVHLGTLEIGAPVEFLTYLTRRVLGKFRREEQHRPGKERVFNELVNYYGYWIESRDIQMNVKDDEIEVTEQTLYHFQERSTDKISHVIKIFGAEANTGLGTSHATLSDVNRAGQSQRTISATIVGLSVWSNHLFDAKALAKAGADKAPVEKANILRHTIVARRYLAGDMVPKNLVDAVSFEDSYTRKLENPRNSGDPIAATVEIAHPTRALAITVRSTRWIIGDLKVGGWSSAGGMTLRGDEFDIDLSDNLTYAASEDKCRKVRLAYPPMAAALEIEFIAA
jgi:hypothetical protein